MCPVSYTQKQLVLGWCRVLSPVWSKGARESGRAIVEFDRFESILVGRGYEDSDFRVDLEGILVERASDFEASCCCRTSALGPGLTRRGRSELHIDELRRGILGSLARTQKINRLLIGGLGS